MNNKDQQPLIPYHPWNQTMVAPLGWQHKMIDPVICGIHHQATKAQHLYSQIVLLTADLEHTQRAHKAPNRHLPEEKRKSKICAYFVPKIS